MRPKRKLYQFLAGLDKVIDVFQRNIAIIEQADLVLAFWDGTSHGTKYVIDNCKRRGSPVKIFMPVRPD